LPSLSLAGFILFLGALNSDQRRRRNTPKVDFHLTKPPKPKKTNPDPDSGPIPQPAPHFISLLVLKTFLTLFFQNSATPRNSFFCQKLKKKSTLGVFRRQRSSEFNFLLFFIFCSRELKRLISSLGLTRLQLLSWTQADLKIFSLKSKF